MIAVRDKAEIETMREGGRLLSLLADQLASLVVSGRTGVELDALVREFAQSHQASPSFLGYRGYPASLCVSVNDRIVHGVPDDLPFREGDIISVDVGLRYRGFHTDMAFTKGVGRVSLEAQTLMEATCWALKEAVGVIRPQVKLLEIAQAVEREIRKRGLTVIRQFTGHGIGRELHEEPIVPNHTQIPPSLGELALPEGAVVALEPIVTTGRGEVENLKDGWSTRTQDGALVAHFEVTVLVGPKGGEVLTPLPASVSYP